MKIEFGEANIEEVVNWIEDLVRDFNFLMPGIDQSLGRDIVVAGAMAIADRSITDQRSPDGAIWLANEFEYAERKARDYGVFDTVNVRTGQMLSLLSLKGRPEISETSILMVYGIGEPPFTSAAPTGLLSDEDKKVTDYEKAQFAHASGRDFYGIDEQFETAVYEVCQEVLDRYLEECDRG